MPAYIGNTYPTMSNHVLNSASRSLLAAAILASSLLVPFSTTFSQDDETPKTTVKKKPAIARPTFKTPPGKAQRKGSAATRAGKEPIKVAVLTPETYGMSYSTQPSFFWFQSDAAKAKQIIFNLYEEGSFKKIVKVPLNKAYAKGINRLDLTSLKVALEPGKSYSWSITFETNRRAPSLNSVSKGLIKCAPLPATIAAQLEAAGLADRSTIYAQNGAWHELLTTMDELIKANPGDASLKAERDEILAQVGLKAEM